MAKKAQILVEAVDMTRAALGSVERNLKSVNEASNTLARSFQSVLAATGAIEFGRQMVTSAMQAEQASKRLDAVLRATGNAAGFAKGELDDMADSLAMATQFDDESIRGAQATLLKFGNVTGGVFKEGLELAADYAAFMGTEIPDAAQVIGKALSSPTDGLGALERQIGKLRPEQEALIKQFMDQGRVLEAQGVVLDVLRSKIGGTAEIMNSGLMGASKAATKAWDELMESLGKSDAVGGTVQRVMRGLADLLNDIKNDITEADTRLDRMMRNAAAARAFAPAGAGPAIGPDGKIIGGGRFGRRGAGLREVTAAPSVPDNYQNGFDTGAMRKALAGLPVAAGSAKPAEKTAFDRALESLTKEAAGAAQVTRLGQISAEIAAGVYGKLTVAQATRLKDLAAEIDLGKKNKELAQEIDEFYKKAGKENEQQAEQAMRALGNEAEKRKQIRDSIIDTYDPSRKLYEEIARIDDALAQGIITDEQADNALFHVGVKLNKLNSVMGDVGKMGKSSGEELADAMAQWGKGFSRVMGDMVITSQFSFDRIKDSFRGLLADIVAMQIDKRMTQSIVKAGSGFLDKLLGGSGRVADQEDAAMGAAMRGGSGGGFFDGVKNFFSGLGFANGGSFAVAGAGGTDSQYVNFMATPGERVTVETPAQQMANRRGAGVNITQHINVGGNVTEADLPRIVEAARQGAMSGIINMRDRGEF